MHEVLFALLFAAHSVLKCYTSVLHVPKKVFLVFLTFSYANVTF
jgi:hypothetical protein